MSRTSQNRGPQKKNTTNYILKKCGGKNQSRNSKVPVEFILIHITVIHLKCSKRVVCLIFTFLIVKANYFKP